MLFTAFSGVFLGTLAAIAMLLSKPATAAKAGGAGIRKIGDYSVSYQKGFALDSETPGFKSRMVRYRRKLPGSLVFNEGEVNYYFLKQFQTKPEEGEEANVEMGAPNLRFAHEKMILSSVIVMNPNSDPFELTFQTEINFEATETGPKLKVGEGSLNSLPLPSAITNMLIGKILGAATLPTELSEPWKAVKEIKLEESKFVVSF